MGEEHNNHTAPRICVACLAAYNNGILHGAWIDAAQDEFTINAEITSMLRAPPIADADEWAIHDYKSFESVSISAGAVIEQVAELAAFIAEHGRLGAELIGYFGGLWDAQQALEDRYLGVFTSLVDYVQEVMEEYGHPGEPALLYRLACHGAGCGEERRRAGDCHRP